MIYRFKGNETDFCFCIRTRERAIQEKIKILIDTLPYQVCKSTRPSKSTILEKAIEFILTMEEDVKILQKKLDVNMNDHFDNLILNGGQFCKKHSGINLMATLFAF